MFAKCFFVLFSERLRLFQNNGTKVQYYTNDSWNYLCYDDSWGASYLCQRLHLPT